jgi:isoleucyl-tRNA synthetase
MAKSSPHVMMPDLDESGSTDPVAAAAARAKLTELPDHFNFPKTEEAVMDLWRSLDAFQTSLKLSKGKPEYTFYDGPPFATGLPHYGHILAGTIKDTVTRYAHQTGHHVTRRFGWDCHGLPVEHEIDKKLGIKGRDDVMEMGIDKYNAECRSIVTRYTSQWEQVITRLGRWIDFKNDYKTMEPWYMESVWWVFKQLWEKKLVYQAFKIMPFSTALNTPVSNFEANLAYTDVTDPSVTVTFPLEDEPEVAFLAWTTTPWTLPSNLALCVNPELKYVRIRDLKTKAVWILAESRLPQVYPKMAGKKAKSFKPEEHFEVLATYKGTDLEGIRYIPLFEYFIERKAAPRSNFRILVDDYVTSENGTGIVHQAPAFGEDDYRVCKKFGIIDAKVFEDLPCPVDANGRFTAQVPEFEGRHIKEADDDICKLLKQKKRLLIKSSYQHSYPFCWRSDTPLIYKAVPSWFIEVTNPEMKEKLVSNNEETYWVPDHVKTKRFRNWLVDARDWAVSRNRYWGTPLPIWMSEDREEMICIGSIAELEELSGERVEDLHRDKIDHITIPSKRPGMPPLRRVDEVFDCWFESGSMPYAQQHYPFENKERFEGGFPADFIAEGLDQTRGWFYTLMVISTMLFGKPAFKNLVVNGLVLAEDGKKMSKRLKNYPDPSLVTNQNGADALRMYLINSPVVRAEPLAFKAEGVKATVGKVLLPWYNSWRFLAQNIKRLQEVSSTLSSVSVLFVAVLSVAVLFVGSLGLFGVFLLLFVFRSHPALLAVRLSLIARPWF